MTSRPYPDPILIIGNNRSYILKQTCIYQLTLPCPWIITHQAFGRSQPKNTILVHRGITDSVLPFINRPESPFRRIILTNILQIGKVCLCTFRSYYQWRMTLVLFSHSSHYIKLTGDHIIYKNMLGTEKNFSLRYPLDINRKTIDTGLIIHFLVNQHKGTYLPRLLMKDKESFIKGEEQQFVRSIFHNGNNFLIFGGRIMFEGTRYRIKPVDTSPISSHPDYSVTILKETINSLVA